MTRAEYNAMSAEQKIQMRADRERKRINRINAELKAYKMAYMVKDFDGNTFTYEGLSNGFPSYRGVSCSKHIFDMSGLTVMQQYA